MDSLDFDETYAEKNLLPLAKAAHLGQLIHNIEEPNYYQPIAVKGPLEGISCLELVDLLDNSFKDTQMVRYMDNVVPSQPKDWDHQSLPSHFCQ